eukprot:312417_1
MERVGTKLDENTLLVKQGYLMKESKHLGSMRRRWMVLNGTSLLSYKDPSHHNATETFDLSQYQSTHISGWDRFQITSPDNTHNKRYFKANSNQKMLEWVQSIQMIQKVHDENYTNAIKMCKCYVKTNSNHKMLISINPIFYDIKYEAKSRECIVKWNVFLSPHDLKKINIINCKLFIKVELNVFHKHMSPLIQFDSNNRQYQYKFDGLKTGTLYKMRMVMFQSEENDKQNIQQIQSVTPILFQFRTDFNYSDFIDDLMHPFRNSLVISGYLREIKNAFFEHAILNIIMSSMCTQINDQGFINFIYESNYDRNGICYFLGTHFGSQQWRNPAYRGAITLNCNTGWASGCLYDMLERTPRYSLTCHAKKEEIKLRNDNYYQYLKDMKERNECKQNICITIDFGSKLRITPNCYTLMVSSARRMVSSSHVFGYLRYWNLEASNDNRHWYVLKQHQNDETLKRNGQSHSWIINNCIDYYQYFRIKMTGKNARGNYRFTCIGFEIYGHAVFRKA